MAQIKYYIEPTAFDRGFKKAVEHYADWCNLLIDLGGNKEEKHQCYSLHDGHVTEDVKHQCYSLRDGHVEASKEYLSQCLEITLENYKEIAGEFHTDCVPYGYLIDGEVVTVIIDELEFDESHVEVYDMLPGEIKLDGKEEFILYSCEHELEAVAKVANYATFETMELIVGKKNALIMPKDSIYAIKDMERPKVEPVEYDEELDIDFDIEDKE